MPIYEYSCKDCKQLFEDWQKDYEEREIPCPVCGGSASRLISSTSFVLKGGGWYASGYNAPGTTESSTTPAAAPAPEGGTAPASGQASAPAGGQASAPATETAAKPCTPCAAASGACSTSS